MADEATDALIPEAPSTEAAAPTEAPAPDPFEKRYADLRSEFDRKNALIDRATKGDLDAIRSLGFEYEEPDEPEPETYEDPYAQEMASTKKELEDLKQWRIEQQAHALANEITDHIGRLEGEAEVKLTEKQRRWIFNEVIQNPSPETTEQAFKEFLAEREALENQIRETLPERGSRPVKGQAASKEYDPVNATDEERLAFMMASMGHGKPAA